MKSFENIEELIKKVDDDNYYYRGNYFESRTALKRAARDKFDSVTEDIEDREEYYKSFGLNLGEIFDRTVKRDKYYIEDSGMCAEVIFVEFYIDSGVPQEDYFCGYVINEY